MTKLACIAGAILIPTGCSASVSTGPTEFERYKSDCQEMGGYTTMTHGPTWSESTHYQCIGKDGPLMPEVSF